jgi:sulfite exporter TauE/SafE
MTGLLAGGVIGLLGSLHCLGMCGPLALALPGGQAKGLEYFFGRLLYNVGRVVMYSLLGAVIGVVGGMFRISGLQQWLSIAVGILMLVGVLFPARLAGVAGKVPGFATLEGALRRTLSALFARRSLGVLLLIGFLNGFLPCGLVYVALGAASTTGGPAEAAVLMAGFGFGTIPAMLGVSLFGGRISGVLRAKLSRAVPVVIAMVAVLLILRGLGLGIPYVSPKVNAETEDVNCCH